MRIALGISYAGMRYQGWQSQPSGQTVQDHLERALRAFIGAPVRVHCAGRTDAGVHALMQVVHFDTSVQRRPFSWVRGTNHFLPPDIAVQWARVMPERFHARGCAVARRYTYLVLDAPVRPSLMAGRAGWSCRPLDAVAMQAAAQQLLGEHDFTSFRASACQALTPVKTMQAASVRRHGSWVRCDFRANAFLYHMVRNVMGCLITVGQGRQAPSWMRQVLAARSRDAAAPTFAADGLYFAGPVYGREWAIPEQTPAHDWFPAA